LDTSQNLPEKTMRPVEAQPAFLLAVVDIDNPDIVLGVLTSLPVE